MNIVFYSYKKNKHEHINTHELHRLEHSIKSIREFNNEIPVYLFCDDPSLVPPYFRLNYNVNVLPFVDGFDHDMLSAWSIHRWYNLKYFTGQTNNILYLDSDTIVYHDIEYIFNTYSNKDVYGREEFGFRHDPNTGGGKNIRQQLGKVDHAIEELGGDGELYKYCCGVILLNNNIHSKIVQKLEELTELMEQFRKGAKFMPIPNTRIVDQYAVWILLGRISARGGLFGIQDVTQGYIEQKHQEFFNPVILHYTTKKEQEFAQSDSKYNNLLRDVDQLAEDIDPYHLL